MGTGKENQAIGRRSVLAGMGVAAAGAAVAIKGGQAVAAEPVKPHGLTPLQRGESAGPVAYRGTILYFTGDPGTEVTPNSNMKLIEDGFLGVGVDGKVIETGTWDPKIGQPGGKYDGRVVDYSGKVIMPGFIDCHVHYVQMDTIAGYGDQILQWLDKYIFPGESKFQDIDLAREVAGFFLDTLLASGTTTALVWSTTPEQSADGFFEEAQKRNLRMITGAVVQDESAWGGNQNDGGPGPVSPDERVEAAKNKTTKLIDKWHGVDRLLYAVTPRFAPSCSWPMLTMCADILDGYKSNGVDVWFQTHLSENLQEEAVVRLKYKDSGPGVLRTYAEAYAQAKLFRQRALFAHCVEINAGDRAKMAASGASIGHSPTSNFFLGSGYFNPDEARKAGIRYGYGTDCGGGTHYSILFTAGAAYKAAALRARQYIPSDRLPALTWPEGPIEPKDWPATNPAEYTNTYPKLTAWQALYRATRGGAEALYLENTMDFKTPAGEVKQRGGIGSFLPGNEADFQVLTLAPTAVVDRRIQAVQKRDMNKPPVDWDPGKVPANDGRLRTPIEIWHEKLFALMIMSDERATFATYIMGKLAYHKEHGIYRPYVDMPIR